MQKQVARLSILILVVGVAALFAQSAATPNQGRTQPPDMHPYHTHLPSKALPATLDPAEFKDNRSTFATYTLAGQIRGLLYQEPCFCPCHREQGHQSLLDCFAGTHGVSCYLCKQEAIYCYEQKKLGKSAKEIRKGLMNNEWNKVDVAKYTEEFLAGSR